MRRDVPAQAAHISVFFFFFFYQVCLILRADSIQSAGVTIHEDIYIFKTIQSMYSSYLHLQASYRFAFHPLKSALGLI